MKKQGSKKILLFTCIGACLELLVVILTGAFGASPLIHGLKDAIKGYGLVWAWNNTSTLGLISLSLLGFSCLLLIINVIFCLRKKKLIMLLTSLCLFLAMAFLPFLFLLAFPQAEAGELGRKSLVLLGILLVWNITAIILLSQPLMDLYRPQPEMQAAPAKGLSELEIKAIVEDYIKAHEEEMHNGQPVPAPVEEEPEKEPVEEPVEEAPAEEEPEEEELSDEEEDEEEGGEGDEYEEVEVVNEQGETIK